MAEEQQATTPEETAFESNELQTTGEKGSGPAVTPDPEPAEEKEELKTGAADCGTP